MRLAVLSLASWLAVGCTVPTAVESDDFEAQSSAGGALGARGDKLWSSYVARVTTGVALQEDCKPRRVRPKVGVTPRGVIVLFHGFTACPQQFFEIAGDLSAAGFDVLLPLLPGHGRQPSFVGGKRVDDLRDLPDEASRGRYAQLAAEMTDVVRDARGARVVGGLSVGGMVATSALVQGGNAWTRGILYAPFFGASGFGRWASLLANTLAPNARHGWGDGCEESTRPGGRAGICEFTFSNLRAGTVLGREVLARAASIRAPVQLVGVEADAAADDGLMDRLLDDVRTAKAGCFYPKGVPHAFISKHDHAHLDHDWLPGLHRATVAFAAQGTWLRTSGISSEYGYGRCAPL
jgi:pimeloyl-ACP methyl ester carboxylesterase